MLTLGIHRFPIYTDLLFTNTVYYIYTDPEGRSGVIFLQEQFMDGGSRWDSE